MQRTLLLITILGLPLWAQMTPPVPEVAAPLTELREYLSLSEAQLNAMLAINREFNLLLAQREQRLRQVDQEIAEETRKESLDPQALGIRYAESEAICRELRAQYADVHRRHRASLTPGQSARLRTLEEAQRLMPAISQAQQLNIWDAPRPFLLGYLPTGVVFGLSGTQVGGASVAGIRNPFPGNIIPANRINPLAGINRCLSLSARAVRLGDFSGFGDGSAVPANSRQ